MSARRFRLFGTNRHEKSGLVRTCSRGLPNLFFLLLVIVFLGPETVRGQGSPSLRNIKIDDFFALRWVGDPRISPEGRWVAYTVTVTDLEKDQSETAIWMIPAAGGEPIRMTAKGYSATRPRWSPDGKYLSFQAGRDEGKSQVWTLNRNGGDAQQVTEVKQGIRSYDWSPDGKRLLLSIQDPKPEDLMEEEARKKEKPKPWVIDRLQFKRDNIGYLDRRRTHLYVLDLQSRDLRQITSGDFDASQPAWSPDGKLIAFVSNRTEEPDSNRNSDIWIASADNPDKGKTLIQVTTNPGADTQPSWSPDGTLLCYVTVTQPEIIWYATEHLAVVPSAGGRSQILTTGLDRNVSSPRFALDGSGIYFILEDSAESHLARLDLPDELRASILRPSSFAPRPASPTRPVAGPRSVRTFHLGTEGPIAVLSSEPHLPSEVFMYGSEGLGQLTYSNRDLLAELNLAEPKNVHFRSKDGTEIEGFIYAPPDFSGALKYPTLLRIHGGPVNQYDHGFNFEAQLFAAHGYVVVMTNPRGSSGYGQDFSMGIYQSWGEKDFEDVMAGIDFAIEKGYADPDRLGVGGWSYGGILTNYVITKTDRFKGAISGASEVLYVANYGHDHYQYVWEKELGLPWENRELWERLSPFNSVQNIVTPTLILCGEEDWNVPVLNSEQLYQALRRLGRTTQLVVYPGEHHGIRRPTFQKDRFERYLAWYDQFVKGEPAAAATALPQ